MSQEEILANLIQLSADYKLDKVSFDSIPSEVYHHRNCPGISSSSLKLITRSIRHFIVNESLSSDSMAFGSAFHDAVLLPDLFAEKYAVAPRCDRRTKEGKAVYENFITDNKDKVVLSIDDANTIQAMKDSIYSIRVARDLFGSGKAEQSFFWIDEETNILCKCRADWIYTDGFNTVLVDLKTTSKGVGRYSFSKTMVDYFYDLSAAYYIDGINKCLGLDLKTMAIIAINTTAPYDVGLYCLGEKTIEIGRQLYKDALKKYAHHIINPDAYLDDYINKDFQVLDINDWATDINNRRD